MIKQLNRNGNYMSAHSDKHLLYCDWNKRDSTLITKPRFFTDVSDNYFSMTKFAEITGRKFFLPPYEWYNDTIALWSKEMGIQLINYTPGTLSHADYTTPKDKNYRSSEEIYNSIINYEKSKPAGLKGFILLMHIGAGPERTDKFYNRLPELIKYLKQKGYHFQTVDKLLATD